MFGKLCDEYNGDSKGHAVDCDGVENPETFDIWLPNYMRKFNLPELHLLLGIGQKLYDAIVLQFEDAFIQSGNSCSTKVHVVCRHIIPFINEYLPKGMGLGAVSEQATESAHSRFKNVWEKSYKCNEESERYCQALFHAVYDVNFVNFSNSKSKLVVCIDEIENTKLKTFKTKYIYN